MAGVDLRGGEEEEGIQLRRFGGAFLHLAAAEGGLDHRQLAIAHVLVDLLADGENRIERRCRSLEGRKELLRDLVGGRAVLKRLLVLGIDAGRGHLLLLQEVMQVVASSNEVRYLQEAEMHQGNFGTIAVYLERIGAAVDAVDRSTLRRRSQEHGRAAEDGAAANGVAANRTARTGEGHATTERHWRNFYGLCSAGGACVGACFFLGAVNPPIALGAAAFAVSSAYLGRRSHNLASENDATSSELRRLLADLDKLRELAVFLEAELVRADLIVNTVRRNAEFVHDVLSRDWEPLGNAIKQVHVRDAIGVCRERVAMHSGLVAQTQKEFNSIRQSIFPRPREAEN